MGRHSLPDSSGSHWHGDGIKTPRAIEPPRPERQGTRRRTVLIATALALAAGAGTALAVRTGLLPFDEGCEGAPVRLNVAAAPDIAPVVRKVAHRAGRETVRSDGHCLDVRVSARTGADVAAALARGGKPEYDAWLPDSSVWVRRAASANGTPTLETTGNVASSPIGLAAVPPAAKKLGWPDKDYTWAELADLAIDDDAPRVGTADPARSATGLLALTEIQNSTPPKDPDDKKKDKKDEKRDKEKKESKKDTEDGEEAEDSDDAGTRTAAVARALTQRTAPGDSQVLATLPHDSSAAEQDNPQRNETLLLSEQAAHTYNAEDDGGKDGRALRLFYPKDGLTLLDYPYTLVDSTRLSTAKTRAATRFQTLLGDSEGRRALAARGFRADNGEADRTVTRQAGGSAPQPYDAPPADPPPAGSMRTAQGIWNVTVQSDRLTIAVDASGSMADTVPDSKGRSRMDVTKASLLQGLSQFTADDEIGLWEFASRLKGDHDYRELVPTLRLGVRHEDGMTQRDRIADAVGKLRPIKGSATGLYDSVLAAYEKARDTYAGGKFNTLVLVTDGANQDKGSISRADLVKKLKEEAKAGDPLPLIAIAVGPDADKKACDEIAKATGGSAYTVEDPAQIHSVILKAVMSAGAGAAPADDPADVTGGGVTGDGD